MYSRETGLLPPITICTLALFYLVWAAMHDIAHGDEGTPEWTCLAMSVPAFAFLCRWAVRALTPKSRVAWLVGTGLLLSLFTTGAVSAMLHPTYPKDPMLAKTFLAAGLPALGLIGYHLSRGTPRRPVQSGS